MLHIPGYRVIRKINQGGMSTVYLAIQISVGRVVALKVMSPNLGNDPSFSERFQREANIVGQLSHPNIVPIYDIGQHDSLNYIAMDYLPGGSLQDRLAKVFTVADALRVTREMASALDHAHEKGYIHRDIKPENILFRADGSSVLTDFGVARGIAGVSRMTNAGQVVGTPHYMSPEQTRGKTVDARSDLYSLGVVFYEMLTGSVPYQSDEAVAIAIKHISAPLPVLPPHCQSYQIIIDKCLAKDPDQRFQRGRDLALLIETLEAGHRTATNTAVNSAGIAALFSALMNKCLHRIRWKFHALLTWRRKEQAWYQPGDADYEALNRETGTHATVVATNSQESTRLQSAIHTSTRARLRKYWPAIILPIMALTVFLFIRTSDAPMDDNAAVQAGPANSGATARSSSSKGVTSKVQHWINENLATEAPQLPVETPIVGTRIEESSSAAQSSQHASSSEPETFQLLVTTTPEDARVRILNIVPRYEPNMRLPAGEYHIEVSHPDYVTQAKWVTISDNDLHSLLTLKPIMAPGEKFTTKLNNGHQGPLMVSIKPGTFIQGDDRYPISAPAHVITLSRHIAISQYEVTFAEYDLFALSTNRNMPDDNRWGRLNRPVINVSWQDAQDYVAWLSEMSGKVYRLPTESEWEYTARAGSTGAYWWSDDPKDAIGQANCRRGCNSRFSGLFGSKTAPVGSFSANEFGLHDTAGNVAEWTSSCFTDHYPLAATSSQPSPGECDVKVVRGGSARNSVDNITSAVRQGFETETRSEYLGFRVVIELD